MTIETEDDVAALKRIVWAMPTPASCLKRLPGW
jgi:hypothetical protein